MTRDVLNITADVLEKAAAYIDAVESEKIEAVAAERSKIASALKNRYEEATGESLEDSFLSKLAASDTDIIKLLNQWVVLERRAVKRPSRVLRKKRQ